MAAHELGKTNSWLFSCGCKVGCLHLYKEEDERLLLVGGVADDEHPPLLRQAAPPGDYGPDVLVILVLEDDEILRADQHSSRAIPTCQ